MAKGREQLITGMVCALLVLSGCSKTGDMGGSEDAAQRNNLALRQKDDPALAQMAVKARQNWPKFAQLFKEKNGKTEADFQVKGPFTEGVNTEHFWIDVTSIDGNKIEGLQNEDGESIKSIHQGDKGELMLDTIEDWLYDDGKEAMGGFSFEVLGKDAFAGINGYDITDAAQSAEAKANLQKHWDDIVKSIKTDKPPVLDQADIVSIKLVLKLKRLCKGNDGVDPANSKLAELAGLPVQVIDSMMTVQKATEDATKH